MQLIKLSLINLIGAIVRRAWRPGAHREEVIIVCGTRCAGYRTTITIGLLGFRLLHNLYV